MDLKIGVKAIELIPTFGNSNDITPRLEKFFSESISMRAAIAFWTPSFAKLTSMVGPSVSAFGNDDSYLCVDIQQPTNIDSLATLCQNGISLHLNLRRLDPAYKKETSSTGLLHTKLLLADKMNGDAEIWIGSHNWTQFALKGPNTEATLSVTCDRFSPLYSQVFLFLEHIRDRICDPFDLSMVDKYKQVQKDLAGGEDGEIATLIELECDNAQSVGSDTIWFFGTEIEDYTSLTKVGGNVRLLVHDSQSNARFLHHAKIIQTGEMAAHNYRASGISFTDKKQYAFSSHRGFPKLNSFSHVPTMILDQAKFFVTLQLTGCEYRSFSINEYVRKKKNNWVNDGSYLFEEIGETYRFDNYFDETIEPDLPVRIQVPFFKRESKGRGVEKVRFLELPLEEKRASGEYRLVRKALIFYE